MDISDDDVSWLTYAPQIQLQDDWLVPEGYLSEDEGLDAGEEGHKGESMKRSKEMKRVSTNMVLPTVLNAVYRV